MLLNSVDRIPMDCCTPAELVFSFENLQSFNRLRQVGFDFCCCAFPAATYWHDDTTVYINVPVVGDLAVYIGITPPTGDPSSGGWDVLSKPTTGANCIVHQKALPDLLKGNEV